MEVLRFINYAEDVEISISTANIQAPWKRFQGRVKDAARTYCDYSTTMVGTLSLADVDGNFAMKELPGDMRTREWRDLWPVFYETCKYNTTITFKNLPEEPKLEHPNKEVTDQFATIKLNDTGDYLITGELDFLNEPGIFDLAFRYRTYVTPERTEHLKFRVV